MKMAVSIKAGEFIEDELNALQNSFLDDKSIQEGCNLLKRCFLDVNILFEESSNSLKSFLVLLIHPRPELRKATLDIIMVNQEDFVAHRDVVAPALRDLLMKNYKDEMLAIWNFKEEFYILKLWEVLVILLGKTLHKGSSLVNRLLEVIEKGLKSRNAALIVVALKAWKHLITNFLPESLTNASRLKLLMKPFTMVQHRSKEIVQTKCDVMWFLACRMDEKLVDRFEELCIGVLRFSFSIKTFSETSVSLSTRSGICKSIWRDVEMQGLRYLVRILESVSTAVGSEISSGSLTIAADTPALPIRIPHTVVRKYELVILQSLKVALRGLLSTNAGKNTTEVEEIASSVLKLLMDKLDLMKLSESKEDIDCSVLFLQTFHLFLRNNTFPPSLSLVILEIIVAGMPPAMLCSPLYQLDCKDMANGVPAVTFLRLLLNVYFVRTSSDELLRRRFLTIFTKLTAASSGDTALNILETSVRWLQSKVDGGDVVVQMLLITSQHFLFTYLKLSCSERESYVELLPDLLCLPVSVMMADVAKVQSLGETLIVQWKEIYRTCLESASHTHLVIQKVLQLWPLDRVLDPEILNDIVSMASVIVENLQIPENHLLFGEANKKCKLSGNISLVVDLLVEILKSLKVLWSRNGESSSEMINKVVSPTVSCFSLVTRFLNKVSSSDILTDVLGKLTDVLSEFYTNSLENKEIEAELESVLESVSERVGATLVGCCSTELLVQTSLLLAPSLVHPCKSISSKSRSIFLRLFGNNYSVLAKCQSLKKVLREIKPPLVPNLDVDLEGDISSLSESSQEAVVVSPVKRYGSFLSIPKEDLPAFSLKKKPALAPMRTSPRKAVAAKSIDEMSEKEFVKIVPSTNSSKSFLTKRQKETLAKKTFLPAMYNDLSQQSQESTLSQSSQLGSGDATSGLQEQYSDCHPSPSIEIIGSVTHKKVQNVKTVNSDGKECSLTFKSTEGSITPDGDNCSTPSPAYETSSDESTVTTLITNYGSSSETVVVSRSVKKDAKINSPLILELNKLETSEIKVATCKAECFQASAEAEETKKDCLGVKIADEDDGIIPSSIDSLNDPVFVSKNHAKKTVAERKHLVTDISTSSDIFFSCASADSDDGKKDPPRTLRVRRIQKSYKELLGMKVQTNQNARDVLSKRKQSTCEEVVSSQEESVPLAPKKGCFGKQRNSAVDLPVLPAIAEMGKMPLVENGAEATGGSQSSTEKLLMEMGIASNTPSSESVDAVQPPDVNVVDLPLQCSDSVDPISIEELVETITISTSSELNSNPSSENMTCKPFLEPRLSFESDLVHQSNQSLCDATEPSQLDSERTITIDSNENSPRYLAEVDRVSIPNEHDRDLENATWFASGGALEARDLPLIPEPENSEYVCLLNIITAVENKEETLNSDDVESRSDKADQIEIEPSVVVLEDDPPVNVSPVKKSDGLPECTSSSGTLKMTIKVPKFAMENILPNLPAENRRKHRRKHSSPKRSPISTRLRANKQRLSNGPKQERLSSSGKRRRKSEDNGMLFGQFRKNVADILGNNMSSEKKLSPIRLRFTDNSNTSPVSRSQMILQASIRSLGGSPRPAASPKLLASNVISPLHGGGILKRTAVVQPDDADSLLASNKRRKVSFADPLVQASLPVEETWTTDPEDTELTASDVCNSSSPEEDDCGLPVYPELIDCGDSIVPILTSLSSSIWVRGLRHYLKSKNVTTIGHLSRLTAFQVSKLPFRVPKVQTLRTALKKYHLLRKKVVAIPEETAIEMTGVQEEENLSRGMVVEEDYVSPSESSDDEPLPSVEDALLELEVSLSNADEEGVAKRIELDKSSANQQLEHSCEIDHQRRPTIGHQDVCTQTSLQSLSDVVTQTWSVQSAVGTQTSEETLENSVANFLKHNSVEFWRKIGHNVQKETMRHIFEVIEEKLTQ